MIAEIAPAYSLESSTAVLRGRSPGPGGRLQRALRSLTFENMETTSRAAGGDLCRVVCFNRRKIDALRRDMPPRAETARASSTYKVLGHAGRLAVLSLLAAEECCVCDVANVLRLPLSTASQHLRALKRAGLAVSRREGKLVFYFVADERARELALPSLEGVA